MCMRFLIQPVEFYRYILLADAAFIVHFEFISKILVCFERSLAIIQLGLVAYIAPVTTLPVSEIASKNTMCSLNACK